MAVIGGFRSDLSKRFRGCFVFQSRVSAKMVVKKSTLDLKLVFHTFNYNFDSGRVKSQKVPGLASVKASIIELNTGKCQHSCHCVIEAIVKLMIVLVPRDLWFGVATGGAW